MAQVFVGYRRADKDIVEGLVNALKAEGFTVFWDHLIVAGDDWHHELDDRIKEARVCLIVWSNNVTIDSPVLTEADHGHQQRKLIIAAIDSDVALPLRLKTVQYVDLASGKAGEATDFRQDPLSFDWKTHPRFSNLIEGLKRKTGKPQAQRDRDQRNAFRAMIACAVVAVAVGAFAYFQWGTPPTEEQPALSVAEVADAAYLAAGDPTEGYTAALLEDAISAFRELEASETENFTRERQLRLNALILAQGGAFRDCSVGCPLMTVVLAPTPFAISVFETSAQEWAACVPRCAEPARWRDQTADLASPVRWVKHDEIEEFLEFLKEQAQTEHPGVRFRYQLPSAYEWLVAAGASPQEAQAVQANGDESIANMPFVPLPASAETVCDYVNGLNNDRRAGRDPPPDRNETCFDGYHREEWAPVNPGSDRRFHPNAAGLFHLVGNASEWLRDSCGDKIRIIGGSRWDRPVVDARRVQVPTTCDFSRLGNAHRGFRVMRPL